MEGSLATYRARIGLYAAVTGRIRQSRSPSSPGSVQSERALSLRLLPSTLLCGLLLLMCGVEPNPGPSFQCHVCTKYSPTVKSHFEHQREHFLGKILCPFECGTSFAKLHSFQSHISIHHSKKIEDNSFLCPVPDCSVTFGRNITDHLEEHLNLGQSFVCPVENCETLHKVKGSFRSHMSHIHRTFPLTNEQNTSGNVSGASAAPQDNIPSTNRPHDLYDPSDPYPSHAVKHEILRFYMELEGIKILPSSHVQMICEEIALLTEMSHHCLQRKLVQEMNQWGIDQNCINNIVASTFSADPVYNVHHKHHDQEPMTSTHLRKELMRRYYPYVSAVEIPLANDSTGKRRVAHYVPVKDTLETLLRDNNLKEKVIESFERVERLESGIYEDYTDGSAYKEHQLQHENRKCVQLVFFQDAFEFSPFGPAKGIYKSIGMYYYLGNLPAEYRSKVDMIQLALLIQERHIKLTEAEFLRGENGFQKGLDHLIKDLNILKSNGLVIDGVNYPVCFLFCTGDNLGSHQIGSFVQSFTAAHCCRYCPISSANFKTEPHKCENLRTPEQYDNCVAAAKIKWESDKEKAIELQNQRRERARIEDEGTCIKGIVSKNAMKELRSVHHMGIKPQHSALNQISGFHVASPALPPCLAHDLFEGCADLVLAKIFQHWIETKKWFSLETLNRRIKSFQYQGSDKADSPNAIRSYDGVKGHACETWTLLRLLPFIIGPKIKDKEDEYWLLYLKLKQIVEFVCAPKISFNQVMFLNNLIQEYLCEVKRLLPDCLTPKHHFLSHYPNLILIFGPLIRLFTMRFESCHVFFKSVAKACKNFKNITLTLANKYQYRFAYLHRKGVLPEDIKFVSTQPLVLQHLPDDLRDVIPLSSNTIVLNSVLIKSILYEPGLWLVVDRSGHNDLCVGQIRKILYNSSDVNFVLSLYTAENSYSGYYKIKLPTISVCIKKLSDLPDYYPLPSYNVAGQNCLSLKHSVLCM